MFKRVLYEQWTEIVPIVSFVLTAAVFAVLTIRAFFMKKERADRMARLPLAEHDAFESPRESESSESSLTSGMPSDAGRAAATHD